MTLKEYRHIYDKVSLSIEADERILQTLTEKMPDSAVRQTSTEEISASAVGKKKKRILWIAKIAGMAAMIVIPILAVEMMRLSAVSPTEKNAVSKGSTWMKNASEGREYGYPISEYSYDAESCERYDYVINACADFPWYETADDLVDAADLIFSGTVRVSFESLLDSRTGLETDSDTDGTPYTVFLIAVDQVYKGSIDGKSIPIGKYISSDVKPWIEIRRVGWQTEHAGYNLNDMMKDAPEISTGVKYLFLAKTYDDANIYPELINLTQSVYSMEDDQKEETDSDDKASEQGISLSDILEGALERKALDKKEYPNGISIEGEAWSQKIDEESEEDSESKPKEQSDGQAGIGYGGQAGTSAK